MLSVEGVGCRVQDALGVEVVVCRAFRVPKKALRGVIPASHCLVLGATSWAFIAQSYPNLQKLTFY